MAYIGKDFDDTHPNEVETYTLDFAKDIDPQESIVSVVWSCVVIVGTDALAATRLLSVAIKDTKTTSIVIGTMLDGVKYRVGALVTTDKGDLVFLYSHIACKNPDT